MKIQEIYFFKRIHKTHSLHSLWFVRNYRIDLGFHNSLAEHISSSSLKTTCYGTSHHGAPGQHMYQFHPNFLRLAPLGWLGVSIAILLFNLNIWLCRPPPPPLPTFLFVKVHDDIIANPKAAIGMSLEFSPGGILLREMQYHPLSLLFVLS